MTRSAITLTLKSGATGALLIMAHPQRWRRIEFGVGVGIGIGIERKCYGIRS